MKLTKEMQHILDRLHEQDYDRRIDVMTPDEAREFVAEVAEGNGVELSDVDMFGSPVPEDGFVIYALHPNGESKTFIFNANDKYSHLYIEIESAFEYAYGYELKEDTADDN